MFLRSIQWRLIFIIIALTFVLISVIWVFLNFKVEGIFYEINFKKPIQQGLNSLSINEEMSFVELIDRLEGSILISSKIKGSNKSYAIISVIDAKSQIEISSDPLWNTDRVKFENKIFKSDNLIYVLAQNKEAEGSRNKLVNDEFYDFAVSKNLADGKYVLYFKYSRNEVMDTIESFNQLIVYSMILAIAAAIIIGILLSRTIITNIMHKAESITAGEFGQVLEVKSKDEIGKLTRTFNYMSKRLKDMLTEISSEKNKVETILKYMTDGIIAFDIKGNVIHINPAAKEILWATDNASTFDEFSQKYDLDIKLEDVIYSKIFELAREKTIITDEKYIRVNYAPFTDEENKAEGVVMILQDITKQQKLDEMRKEFVANVSHELRTPLTSVKSYTETLLDGAMEDPEICRDFLSVINTEADRMTRLVKDLLQLSKQDNKKMQYTMQELDLVELVKSCAERMKMSAQEKAQVIETFVIGQVPQIMGDKDRLDQLLINIIGNAIKYTPDEGKITVYIGIMYNQAYIKVADTGIGIPEKDLGRIFERFYRVDKARSRQMGGTGLGLSIAKEIVDAHGGTISATSEIDKGTEITVKLPV